MALRSTGGFPARLGPFTTPMESLSVSSRSPQPDKALRPEGSERTSLLGVCMRFRVRGPHFFFLFVCFVF